jgi:ABC-2 type transport system ATP-binding protein
LAGVLATRVRPKQRNGFLIVSESTTVVRVSHLSKRFVIRKDKSIKERITTFGRSAGFREDFYALNDVTFDIEAGTTVGLIGANGSGKSTLLKTIGGILQPTSGSVQRRGRLAALLELGAGFHPDLTGRENVYLNASILGLTAAETDRHFDAIVDFSGIEKFIDTQVKFYSSGMYVRLAFAIAVHVDPDVLLVDEVLAVGDEPFQRKCMDKIRAFQREGRTIVLVSHSSETVGDLCDRGIMLRSGSVLYDGDTKEALSALRADFELQRVDPTAVDFGVGQKIESVALVDSTTGIPITRVFPGQSMRLDITVRSDVELPEWVVGMGIETPLGQSVFGTNTRLLGSIGNEPLVGERTISFDLPDVRLGNGQYFIHASFGTPTEESASRISHAATLESHDDTRNVGVTSIAASYTVG